MLLFIYRMKLQLQEIEKFLIAEKGQYILSEYAAMKQLNSKTVLLLCDKLIIFIKQKDPNLGKC